MKLGFYRAFEDKFRGSRELIKSRLEVYCPFIETIIKIYPESQTVDLGCGRGEWLELMGELGFSAQGVDLDEGMLDACRDIGLKVWLADALEYLKQQPDESQSVVSAFHLVEHIPFDDLQILVEESLRVLKPAGLLILETPNPENIVVGSSSFYLDPTHHNPIPPTLLSFLPEYYGFEKVKILRLQESLEVSESKDVSLLNVLNGVSPDYAVIAQKTAKNEIIGLSDNVFQVEYGVTLEQLAMRFSKNAEDKAQHAEDKAQHAEDKAQHAEDKAQHAEDKAQQIENKAQQASIEQEKTHQIQIEAFKQSTSWRITWPLRALTTFMRWLCKLPLRLLKALVRPIIVYCMRKALAKPKLRMKILGLVRQNPIFFAHLRQFMVSRGLLEPLANVTSPNLHMQSGNNQDFVQHITPHAHDIHSKLQVAIEAKSTGNR
jgi:SAM-dependent methyltransferase